MSSHHIVRDQQEPALLIHDFKQLPIEILHGLLEWSPTVVVGEDALLSYTKLGHKTDLALVNESRLDHWRAELAHQFPVKIMSVSPEDLIPTALLFLSKENHRSVNLLTNEATIFEKLKSRPDWSKLVEIIWISPSGRYIHCDTYSKWLPAGQKVSCIPIDGQTSLRFEGISLQNQVISEPLEIKMPNDGQLKISTKNGVFLIKELF